MNASDPIKVLTRLAPSAAVEELLYSVPLSSAAKIQGFTVANRSAVPTSFRFSISPKGAATVAADYVYYDLPITGNDTFMSTLDVELEAQDVIRVYATLATLSFTLYGGPR